MADSKKHIVVIGAGPGGYAGAFRAADLGMKVTLIDPAANPGGVCLYRGCIPSKALLHVAKLVEESRHASEWGVTFQEPEIDIDKLRAFKDGVVSRLTGGLGSLSTARKINYIQGTGCFESSSEITVTHNDGKTETITFDFAIIATGSQPAMIPGVELSDRIMDSTGALELRDIPESLLVVGGGYIGLELAAVYSAFGSRVSVVEMLPSLIAGADPDIAKVLITKMEGRLEQIMVNTRVESIEEDADGLTVKFSGDDVTEPEQRFARALISIGRRPSSANLGLEKTRVEVDKRGFIQTDEQTRTADPNIFAIGDVAGNPMLAHKATHEAHVAAEVASGEKVRFAPKSIPAVVYTDPEVAWCGLTETEAKEQGVAYQAASFPWQASGRAQAMDATDGLTKLLFDPETHQILGVGIVGAGAGELIGEAALAIEMDVVADDIALTIHPHPTMTESMMEAAEVFLGKSDHYYRPKKK